MQDYKAANPIHGRVFSTQDLWWVGSSWTEEVADFLASTWKDIPLRDVQQFFATFSGAVRSATGSNLPGLMPSGDWVLGLIERALPFLEAKNLMANFRDWDGYSDLSDPLRFYLFLGGNRLAPESTFGILPIVTFSEILLCTTSFSDADLHFLLVDGRDKVAGGKSRDKFVAEVAANGTKLDGQQMVFPALASGALPYSHIVHLLRNHSFVSSDQFIEHLFSMLAEEDPERELELLSIARVTPLAATLANPAVPTSTLEGIARRLSDHRDLYQLFVEQGQPVEATEELVELAAKAAGNPGWSHLSTGGAYSLQYSFSALLSHPNWAQAKNEEGLLPAVDNLIPKSYSEVHGIFPTLDLGYEARAINLVSKGLAGDGGISGVRHKASLGFMMSAAPYHAVSKNRVMEVVSAVLNDQEVEQVSLAFSSFGIGYYLSGVDRLKTELCGEDESSIPAAWILELLA